LGFPDAGTARRLAERISALPESTVEELLIELENRNKPAVPDREPVSPKRRADNVREQAANDPDKETEFRIRSVPTNKKFDIKAQAETYLRERYRNKDGEMTCQICKGPLPFKLDNGQEYFETVPLFPDLRKHHPQNYLALCPNHSAMFQIVNGSRETMRESFLAIGGNVLAVVLAERDLTIYFSKTHIIDLRRSSTRSRAFLPSRHRRRRTTIPKWPGRKPARIRRSRVTGRRADAHKENN